MNSYLTPLLQFQRFFLPALLALLVWATWRMRWRKDLAVGLALYLGLVIIVDGFMNTGIFLPGLEKGSIRYSEVCAAFLLFTRPPASPRRSPYGAVCFFVSLYFSLLFLSVFRSDSVATGIAEFRAIIVPQIVAFVIAMRGLTTPADYRRFVVSLTAVVLVIGLFDFWDVFFDRWLLHSDTLFTPKYWLNRQHRRFGSVFLNPNMLGAFTVLVFPATFIWALNESNSWRRLFAWVGLLALAFCLVETQSRGPMLALGISLMLLTVGPCGGVSRSRRLGFLAALVVVFTLFMPGFYEHAMQRFAEEELEKEMTTEDGRTRETVWGYARLMIADNPVTGIGFGEKQFVIAIDALGFRDKYGEEPLDNPHNSYLQMAVYAGIPALAAFILANLALLWRAASVSWRNADGRTTQAVFGSVVGIAGFLAVIYPDMHMFTPAVSPVYWVFFGLLLSLTTSISQPAPAIERHENSRAHFGHAGPRLAGPSPSLTPQYHRDPPRAAAAGVDRSGELRAATPDGRALRSSANAQQTTVQLDSAARAFGVRSEDGRPGINPQRGSDRVFTREADTGRQKRV